MPLLTEDEFLAHYGILRKSGRYPWGSGENPYERSKGFLNTVNELKKSGMSEADIAKSFHTKEAPFTTTNLRALKTRALNEKKQHDINMAQRLKDKGLSNIAIGQRMGLNESSVRALLTPGQKDKADVLNATTAMLRDQVGKKTYVDIGAQVERSLPLDGEAATQIGLSKQKLATAVAVLQEEGYKVRYVKVPQLGTNHETTMKVLAAPGAPFPKIEDIKPLTSSSKDGGHTFNDLPPLKSVSSERLGINYAEDGGSHADGVIYIRPGVKDLSLGSARYAQVRIPVDGTHYLKGMAMYKTDLPEGKDLVFNTNKSNTGNKLDALKPMQTKPDGSIDHENPFTASVKAGGRREAMNIVNEEGDWDRWSKSLSSQVLSKQSPDLAEKQLAVLADRRKSELETIQKLTNPTVRKKLLDTFADETDSVANDLKAAELPRTAQKVILPISSLKDHEIYAPTYRDGERVVLVRHPHGGPFEIPELTVNNRNTQAKRLMGTNPSDAIGINHKVAERLSGADFDGDTVLVIPNNRGEIKTQPALEGLKNFDPKSAYPPYDGMHTIDGGTYNAETKKVDYGGQSPKGSTKQQEMGKVTNLIADMTIHGANSDELARAVRHSMVVIDSEKHSLDYKGSAVHNGIAQLKEKYQGGANRGASTLITKAGSQIRVPERKQLIKIDKATGKKIHTETGASYVDKNGKVQLRTQISTRLAETHDAHTLSSGTAIERVYADHANKLKALSNEARKESVNTSGIKLSPSAKAAYSKQVDSLSAKLNIALRNAPLERNAQVIANTIVNAKRAANPNMDSDTLKKIKNQALAEGRVRAGASKTLVDITPDEWHAIQAGAITNHKLTQIMNNTDLNKLRELATPRTERLMTATKQARAQQMIDSGYTQAEVADALGVSVSTLKSSLSGDSHG